MLAQKVTLGNEDVFGSGWSGSGDAHKLILTLGDCTRVIFFRPKKEWIEGTGMKVYDVYVCFQPMKMVESRYSSSFGEYSFEMSNSWQFREGQ